MRRLDVLGSNLGQSSGRQFQKQPKLRQKHLRQVRSVQMFKWARAWALSKPQKCLIQENNFGNAFYLNEAPSDVNISLDGSTYLR